MKESTKEKLYDNVEDVWGFVKKASAMYKEAFRKTSKIGQAPKIDDIIELAILAEDFEIPEIDEETSKAEEAEAAEAKVKAAKAKVAKLKVIKAKPAKAAVATK
ncbi:MAG: hypothetical protein ABIH89_03460 [Elusimicrobiota bacterium]